MKKIIALFILLTAAIAALTLYMVKYAKDNLPDKVVIKLNNENAEYLVFQDGNFLRGFNYLDGAVSFAGNYAKTYVTKRNEELWIWDNYPEQFSITLDGEITLFNTLADALEFARNINRTEIKNRANGAVIWESTDVLPSSAHIYGVPLIAQYPELERGCEVTSLAMLLNYYGIGVSKMDLAKQIKKDETPYSVKNGVITFGNPNVGFVGDIYTKKNPGLGVYAGPITELLKQYIGPSALDLTGADFSDLYYFIKKDKPVLVIISSTFKLLPPDRFVTWNTNEGQIKITYNEHSVLITGYDDNYIYFNDPLNEKEKSFAPKDEFIKSWVQMGSQAVTYFE